MCFVNYLSIHLLNFLFIDVFTCLSAYFAPLHALLIHVFIRSYLLPFFLIYVDVHVNMYLHLYLQPSLQNGGFVRVVILTSTLVLSSVSACMYVHIHYLYIYI